jgi:hypothetical protein
MCNIKFNVDKASKAVPVSRCCNQNVFKGEVPYFEDEGK